jgi:hypothetical protein
MEPDRATIRLNGVISRRVIAARPKKSVRRMRVLDAHVSREMQSRRHAIAAI